MELIFPVVCICLLVAFSDGQETREGPCFEFPGDSYLHFTPNVFDNNNDIHYRLKFRTGQENGILLYARGQEGDDEALYIINGKLRYHLFNTSPTGIEGYFGAFLESDERVSIGEWIQVHLYRSWKHREPPQRRVKKKTGFEVNIQGNVYRHFDYLERDDVSLLSTIYLGGFRESLSSTVHNFTGQMKDIYEEKNAYLFENPSLNYLSKVSLTCLDSAPTA
ncbi:hypothetical protein BsWGS_04735 [Bradybaena similaris]